MRIESIDVGKSITIQAHIANKLFTTESTIVKTGATVVLRLHNVEQFDLYHEKAEKFSLCYKGGAEFNNISEEVELRYSESNPIFIAVDGATELTAVHAQRSHARYPYEHELIFSYGTTSVNVHSLDISASGIGVVADRAVPVGTFGMIDVWSPLTKKSRAFQAKVANCSQKALNSYKIGILFESHEQWIIDFINDLQGAVLKEVG